MENTKKCTCCQETKPLTSFALRGDFRKDGTRGRRSRCNSCVSRKYRSKENGRKVVNKNQKRYNKDYREGVEELRRRLREAIGQSYCKQCSQSHPGALTFHHRDPTTKEFGIATGISKRYCFKRLLAEAQKCDVLCANCHSIHHWEEKGRKLLPE